MAADFEVKKDSQNQWYWTFQATDNTPIARSYESYLHRSDCLDSIRVLKQFSPSASVFDMTTGSPTLVPSLA
jgi:uncharacterized protein YegP (UPF0339 family)